mgnify:FL=1
MIIRMSFETLDKGIETVSGVISDKSVPEDLKNVIFHVRDGKVYVAGFSSDIINVTLTDATVELPEGESTESLFQLKAKELSDVVNSFKGLKRTKVEGVELHVRDTEAVLHIKEAPIDEEIEFAEKFYQTSKFRVPKPRVKDIVKNEVQKVSMDIQGTDIESDTLLVYILSLLPTIAKETRESTSNMMFGDEYIYTVLSPYTAIMPNKLPEPLRGFRLKNSVVNFLKNFISQAQVFTFHKEPFGNGGVILTFKVNDSVAVIKCADMSRAFDITNFVTLPDNGVIVDKEYFIDVLKRMSLSGDAAYVEVNIESTESGDAVGSMRVVSKTMTQDIPVRGAKGAGTFSFSIRADLLSSMIFSHASFFDVSVYFYFGLNDKGHITMACSDNTKMWVTKMMNLSPAKVDFAWG